MQRERTSNDRPAALDAKYDPKEFLQAYDTEEVIRRLQQERGLDQGDRALEGKVGMDIGSPERSSNYM
jgi:hypothetical protein|tara:strand:+ start:247 stop:450 length:204 start_codon:yes stop_codon:yes gene_type:complete